MARTSPIHYIAPSAISITPNANNSANDLAVYVAKGAKIKVHSEGIAALKEMPNNTWQEWTMSGRNRRLNATYSDRPFTIYARLLKTGEKTGYLVFAAKVADGDKWKDKYAYVTRTGLATGTVNSNDNTYWWIKLGDVSAPENGQRAVTLDTGILGTDQYNTGWKLDPDDFPENPVRIVLEDRKQWSATPMVVYTGTTGTRTPDGTLDAAIATALGWTGTDPLTFTQGQDIIEPYHYQQLTRLRWLTARLLEDNNDVTDAALYTQLTSPTHGWEPENTLETSRVWRGGALWECLIDGTTQVPWFTNNHWQWISGGTFSLGFYTDGDDPTPIMGLAVRPANVDEMVVPYLLFGQEDVTNIVTSWLWERESDYEALDEAWGNSELVALSDLPSQYDPESADYDASLQRPKKSAWRKLHITTSDLPAGWDAGGGKVGFKCTATFNAGGEEAQIINRISIV